MRIGLYFGSFNPIHHGHLIVASFVQEHAGLDQLWFVVSPQNPLKPSSSLLNEYHRLYLLQLAIEGESRFRASDIEFRLPRPSYTIDTLTYLSEKYPDHQFVVVMGSDSFLHLAKWKNYGQILEHYPIVIYNRPGEGELPDYGKGDVRILQAPLLEISATQIRNNLKAGKSIRYLVPDNVREEIERNGYYRS